MKHDGFGALDFLAVVKYQGASVKLAVYRGFGKINGKIGHKVINFGFDVLVNFGFHSSENIVQIAFDVLPVILQVGGFDHIKQTADKSCKYGEYHHYQTEDNHNYFERGFTSFFAG